LCVCVHVPCRRLYDWADRNHTGTRIQPDPGSVLGKSRSRSERRRRENGGSTQSGSGRANAVCVRMEAP